MLLFTTTCKQQSFSDRRLTTYCKPSFLSKLKHSTATQHKHAAHRKIRFALARNPRI